MFETIYACERARRMKNFRNDVFFIVQLYFPRIPKENILTELIGMMKKEISRSNKHSEPPLPPSANAHLFYVPVRCYYANKTQAQRIYGGGRRGAVKIPKPIVLNSIPKHDSYYCICFFFSCPVPYKLHEAMVALITPTIPPARMYDKTQQASYRKRAGEGECFCPLSPFAI